MLTQDEHVTLDICYSEDPRDGVKLYWSGSASFGWNVTGENVDTFKLFKGAQRMSYVKTVNEVDGTTTTQWVNKWFSVALDDPVMVFECTSNAIDGANFKMTRLYMDPIWTQIEIQPTNKWFALPCEIAGAYTLVFSTLAFVLTAYVYFEEKCKKKGEPPTEEVEDISRKTSAKKADSALKDHYDNVMDEHKIEE